MDLKHGTIIGTGANGQVGTELVAGLRAVYGNDAVIATDISKPAGHERQQGPFEYLDVLNETELQRLFERYRPGQVYHLAAILSATGEKRPQKAWEFNIDRKSTRLNSSH